MERIIIKHIRVKKEDSAFVYSILESEEGIATYSTLEGPKDSPYRDLELQIPSGQMDEVNRVLKQLGELVYEL